MSNILPSYARDFSYEYEGQKLTYTVISEEEKTVETKSGDYRGEAGNNVAGSLIIPSIVTDGNSEFTVIAIGLYSFYNCGELTSVTLPQTVRNINNEAFSNCSSLTKVKCEMLESVSIDQNVFKGVDSEVEIEIPLNTLGIYLTCGWGQFKNIFVDNTPTKSLSYEGLNYCIIDIPDHCEAVLVAGDYSSLEETNIPERVIDNSDPMNPMRYNITAIGSSAFSACVALKSISFSSRSAISLIGNGAFASCIGLTSINIPNSVKTIGESAFSDCNNLTSVSIGSSVEVICDEAFTRCTNLNSIDIPDSVISIGNHSFFFCTSLSSVSIGNSVTSIGMRAFQYCGALSTITFGNSIEKIGLEAFQDCKNLRKVDFSSIESLCGIEFNMGASNPLYYAHNLSIAGEEVKDLVIPSSVKSIGECTFVRCSGLTSVTIPNSVTSIGDLAFAYCHGLTSLLIPNSVTTIGYAAFSNCSGLTSISLSNCIETIGISAFSSCDNLTSIEIPNSIISIGDWAFSGCSSLASVILPNSMSSISYGLFQYCKNISSVTIGSSIKSIGSYAFSSCTSLKEVVLPPSLESIDALAFSENTSLTSIIMACNVKSIGERAFDGCPASSIYITAQTPPDATIDVFSSYSGKLYLQGQDALDSYYDAIACWDRFDSYLMIEPSDLKINGEDIIKGEPNDTFQLSATLSPENVTLPQIFWRSTNPEVASVDCNGLVTLHSNMCNELDHTGGEAEVATCKIIAESLYANGPIGEVVVNNFVSGVDSIESDEYGKREINWHLPYEVYDMNGMKVATSINHIVSGFYIIVQGNSVKKMIIK